jgi:diguanylate cyclase (GGDEF)-like protein
VGVDGSEPETGDTTAVERHPRPGAAGRGERCLVIVYGCEPGMRLPLDREVLVAGRDTDCEIPISHRSISRAHARLRLVGPETRLCDLGSTHGTFLNDRELPPHEEFVLQSGDLLQLGGVLLKYLDGGNLEALYHEEIHRSIVLDGLTGLHTRRALLDFLAREMTRARRHQRPLALLLADADHFKAVNDAWGHLAGDRVLRDLGRVLAAQASPDECVARFGGEEFALVLPETGLEGACARAEQLRGAVELAGIRIDGRRIDVTLSVGVACFEPSMQTPEDFLRAADARLYDAKSAGRNTVS